ncbi:hypothetical protein PZA11_004616 [Diplocarpon coronariae]
MSSLPPSTIKIKRKATDDPVEFLRIHQSGSGGKRQRQGQNSYVFSRQPADRSTAPSDAPSVTPLSPSPLAHPQARRFHIARPATNPNTFGRKRRAEPTVFVERRIRPRSADGGLGVAPPAQGPATVRQQSERGKTAKSARNRGQDGQNSTPLRTEPPPQKRPGIRARTSTAFVPPSPISGPAPLRNVIMPSGSTMPWDVTSERLAAEMQAYTLQEIGKSLAESEASRPAPISASFPRSPSRFKPMRPAQRYAERHPEEKLGPSLQIDEEYADEEMDDDSEYIIDTYVRIPAEALKTEESGKSIGLLVLESQPDIDEFYREEEDSDEEEDDGDEDENAENHYTADYPDEEVASDDEYNRNAYNYRTRNASDLEEYDEEESMFSDDENEATKYPWLEKYGRG